MIIPKDNRGVEEGQLVKVYRNFRKRCWSVSSCEGFYSGKVIGWAETIVLSDCEFVVREKAHWVEGRIIRQHCVDGLTLNDIEEVVYSSATPKSYVWKDTTNLVIDCSIAFFGATGGIYATVWG